MFPRPTTFCSRALLWIAMRPVTRVIPARASTCTSLGHD